MILGWFTGIPSWHGRDGIRIPESGLAGPISHSESASESDGSAVLDGDGIIGDLTGITTPCCITTGDTTRAVEHFITGTISIAGVVRGVGLMVGAAEFTTVLAVWTGLSMETARRLEDSLNRAARAASIRVPSATSSMAGRPGAFPHGDRRVLAAAHVAEGVMLAEAVMVVAAGGDRTRPRMLASWKFIDGGETYAELRQIL